MADQQPKINYRQISDQLLATLDLSLRANRHCCCTPAARLAALFH